METVDLMDPAESRRLAKAFAGAETAVPDIKMEDDGFELPVNDAGKFVIDVTNILH